jgi:hypothetical protein
MPCYPCLHARGKGRGREGNRIEGRRTAAFGIPGARLLKKLNEREDNRRKKKKKPRIQ